ncbi:ARM repeat superfamily protein [Abeliophyllum distichum]|uniref:ARM repeat superfamily protein n=1 Tax=Abeliophyllum distichum TaxID=126358 RepID=A0ABD1VC09_9LAMI
METHQILKLLTQTLSPDSSILSSATDALDSLSLTLPNFHFSLLSIIASGEDQGVKLAAATYLKNFTRRNTDVNCTNSSTSKEFRDALMHALLQVEPPVLKVLIEAFRAIVAVEFVKSNSWPELVPELRSVIENSDLICNSGKSQWNTINALTVLHSLIRPFRYFLNPKLVKEPVPPQLELIAKELLVPLLAVFHHQVEKASSVQGRVDVETEKILLIICKCIYFTVRSHMPSALAPLLPSVCSDLFKILSSITLEGGEAFVDAHSLRRKMGKRGLLIFCTLVTRHRKFSDKLMPDILDCVSQIVKYSSIISKLDFLSERIVSLAFDVISRVLETGPGWRLVSPHFSTLLDSAIFPTLIMNEKDIAEWEEDAEEYMRKNLPSELEEISGWRDDLFTARKSALNLLGVISISKGPPVLASSVSSKRKKGERNRRKDCSSIGELLVLPYLSKFPIPVDSSSKDINEYFGVLMAYSSLLDFLKEQKPGFTATLIRMRVLPLYKDSFCQPYLIAPANWVLGELSPCIPEEMSADIYTSLLKVLTMPDTDKLSCFPVRASSAGAIAKLVENDYMPPEWLPLLQMIVGRISDNEEETSVYLQLLGTVVEIGSENVAPYIPDIVPSLVGAISRCIPPCPDPWPQMVERGFATLALVAQCWENSTPEESEENESYVTWVSRRTTIAKAFSVLLQRAWFRPFQPMEGEVALSTVPSVVLG